LLPSSLLHFFLKNTFRYLFPPEKNKNHWQKAQLTQNGEIQKPQRKRKKSFAPLLLGLLLFYSFPLISSHYQLACPPFLNLIPLLLLLE
jgi:hypothetical protein